MNLFDMILIIMLLSSGIIYFSSVVLSNNNLFIFYMSTISITLLSFALLLSGLRFLFVSDTLIAGLFFLIITWGIVFYIFLTMTLNHYKDITYAISQNFSYVKGSLENLETNTSSRFSTSQSFTIEGVNFTINPSIYELDQLDQEKDFLVQYLPHSKFIINITRVTR